MLAKKRLSYTSMSLLICMMACSSNQSLAYEYHPKSPKRGVTAYDFQKKKEPKTTATVKKAVAEKKAATVTKAVAVKKGEAYKPALKKGIYKPSNQKNAVPKPVVKKNNAMHNKASVPPRGHVRSVHQAMSGGHPFLDALVSAYNHNPELIARVKEQFAVAEAVPRALAGWRPEISATAEKRYDRTNQQSPSGATTAGAVNVPGLGTFPVAGGTVGGVTANRRATAGVSVSQNIYAGGQTVAGVSSAESQVIASQAGFHTTEQTVMLNAAQAYLDLWQRRAIVDHRRSSERYLLQSLAQVKAQADVGEKTISDVALAESRLARAVAERQAAEAEAATAEAVYYEVIRERPADDIRPPAPVEHFLTMPVTKDEVVGIAKNYYPAVIQAVYNEKAAVDNVRVAEGGLLPSVDVTGAANRSVTISRSRQNEYTASVRLTVPLYQRGTAWATLRESTQTAAQNKYLVKQATNNAVQNAITSWENWKVSQRNIEQFKTQVRAAEVNLEGKRQENLVGETTFTDVLDAERELVQARVDLVTALRDYLFRGYQVLASMGRMTTLGLGLHVDRYRVKEHADEVRSKLIGTYNPDTDKVTKG